MELNSVSWSWCQKAGLLPSILVGRSRRGTIRSSARCADAGTAKRPDSSITLHRWAYQLRPDPNEMIPSTGEYQCRPLSIRERHSEGYNSVRNGRAVSYYLSGDKLCRVYVRLKIM